MERNLIEWTSRSLLPISPSGTSASFSSTQVSLIVEVGNTFHQIYFFFSHFVLPFRIKAISCLRIYVFNQSPSCSPGGALGDVNKILVAQIPHHGLNGDQYKKIRSPSLMIPPRGLSGHFPFPFHFFPLIR